MWFLSSALYPLSLEEIKKSIESSASRFGLDDKSPDRFRFSFRANSPNQINKDAVNHMLFLFCHHYLEKHHPDLARAKLKKDIKILQEQYNLDPTQALLLGKTSFPCYSKASKEENYVRIEFVWKAGNFIPSRWDSFSQGDTLHFVEEDLTLSGKKTSFTKYQGKNCPVESRKDRYNSGIIDEWWFYENCNLSKIEYDENQNGNPERTCYFSLGKLKYCEGLGEKEEALARLAKEQGNLDLASLQYGNAILEIKKESSKPSFRLCGLFREKVILDFDRKDFESFQQSILGFLENPYCEKTTLEILGYKAYYELYGKKDYSNARKTYKRASQLYFEEKGEHHPDLVINTALAELQLNDPLSCLVTLEKVTEKTLPMPQSFYFAYFKGSCLLEMGNSDQAVSYLKKSWDNCIDRDAIGTIAFKLALAERRRGRIEPSQVWLDKAIVLDPSLKEKIGFFPDFNKPSP